MYIPINTIVKVLRNRAFEPRFDKSFVHAKLELKNRLSLRGVIQSGWIVIDFAQ